MKVWALTEEFSEGKYLVVRRDGTTPAWPHFVIGANDPCAFFALTAYANVAAREGLDPEFVSSVRELAALFDKWRVDHQFDHKPGDPDAGPHRKDNPTVLAMMRRETDVATLIAEHHALSTPAVAEEDQERREEVLGSSRTQERPSRAPSHDSLTKFTPGPWGWDAGLMPPDGPQRYADIYINGGDTIIANFNDCIPEGRANAHLISPAPELYEALDRLCDKLTDRWQHLDCEDGCCDLQDALSMAEQALAEARGESARPSEGRLSSISAREAQAEPERPEPLQWACHARGADEWELCASYEEALAMADRLNAGDDDGLIRAVPALWPYAASPTQNGGEA